MQKGMELARLTYRHWSKLARAIGVVQTRFIMFLIYVVAVLPFGLVFRIRRDPLQIKKPAGSNWTPCPEAKANIQDARLQY